MNLDTDFEIRGSKVSLRLFHKDDITDKYIGWLNDPQVVRFSNQRFITHDRENCLKYLDSFVNTDNLFLSVRRNDTGQAIGTMSAYISRHHSTVDIGILIGELLVWGKGYGQDAWNTLTQWLLTQDSTRKITGGALACNQAMIHIMEHSGMKLEAVKKLQEIVNGVPQDIMYYSKFRND